MKEGRDFAIINRIDSHFNDLNDDLKEIDSFEAFKNKKEKRRAILFDFLQIGELINQLSSSFISSFNNKHAVQLIAIRNRIVHGYSTIRDDIIYTTLKNNLPGFIDELDRFARAHYYQTLKKYLGKRVRVIIDRPKGFKHNNIIYPINYGYIEEMTALDGEFQDAYIIDIEEPIKEIDGVVIAIIHRKDDIEDKLVVAEKGIDISDACIDKAVYFQEQFFNYTIERDK